MGANPSSGHGAGKIGGLEQIDQLAKMGTSLFKAAKPVATEFLGQTVEALKTGGVGARIPIIQRAVEAAKMAAGTAMRGTGDRLAGTRLAGTPFGEQIMANARMAGDIDISRIPTSIAESIIGMGVPFSGQMAGLGVNAVGNSAALELNRQQFNSSQFSSFMKDLKDSIQSVATRGGGGGGGSANTAPTSAQYSSAPVTMSGGGGASGPMTAEAGGTASPYSVSGGDMNYYLSALRATAGY